MHMIGMSTDLASCGSVALSGYNILPAARSSLDRTKCHTYRKGSRIGVRSKSFGNGVERKALAGQQS